MDEVIGPHINRIHCGHNKNNNKHFDDLILKIRKYKENLAELRLSCKKLKFWEGGTKLSRVGM